MAAALALLALVLPAAGEEWTDYSRDYSRDVVALLGRLPSTQRHWAYLLREKIDLKVTDSPARVSDNTLACFDPIERRMYLDEVLLLDSAEELADRKIAREEIAETLAWKSLPVVVHETTHAMAYDGLARAVGLRFHLHVLEGEMLSFYDEVLAMRDMFRERPELWSRERILKMDQAEGQIFAALEKGPADLDAMVRRIYSGLPSVIKGDKAALSAQLDATIAAIEGRLDTFRQAAAEGQDLSELESGIVARKTFASLAELIRYDQKALVVRKAARKVLAEPRRFAAFKGFYERELAERLKRIKEETR
jgi:hypothetical protein